MAEQHHKEKEDTATQESFVDIISRGNSAPIGRCRRDRCENFYFEEARELMCPGYDENEINIGSDFNGVLISTVRNLTGIDVNGTTLPNVNVVLNLQEFQDKALEVVEDLLLPEIEDRRPLACNAPSAAGILSSSFLQIAQLIANFFPFSTSEPNQQLTEKMVLERSDDEVRLQCKKSVCQQHWQDSMCEGYDGLTNDTVSGTINLLNHAVRQAAGVDQNYNLTDKIISVDYDVYRENVIKDTESILRQIDERIPEDCFFSSANGFSSFLLDSIESFHAIVLDLSIPIEFEQKISNDRINLDKVPTVQDLLLVHS